MTIILEFAPWLRVSLVIVGLALIFSCLCRARHMTTASTFAAIRYATTALASAGLCLVLAAAFRPEWVPVTLLVLAVSTLSVQWISARYWRAGLPAPFKKS